MVVRRETDRSGSGLAALLLLLSPLVGCPKRVGEDQKGEAGVSRLREGWADSGGVRLHFVEAGETSKGVPVLFVPGALGNADDYRSVMEALLPRRSVAVSLRGRGRSDAPETGYSFEDHVGDIAAVVEETKLGAFCISGSSMGVPYAVGYSVAHPSRVAGLILQDFPARYPPLSAQWAENNIRDLPDRAPPHAIEMIQRQSRERLLWGELSKVGRPVLIMRGNPAKGSLLSEAHVRAYLEALPEATWADLADAGHDLTQPDLARFIAALKGFLAGLDARYGGQ